MGKKSDETQGHPRIIKIISGTEDKLARLEDLQETVKVLDNRLSRKFVNRHRESLPVNRVYPSFL